MTIIGIAAGPDQLADGEDPSVLAKVDADGNVGVIGGVDQNARAARIPVYDDNELLRQNLAVSKAILLVLADAFHPGTDPQKYIDAMTDQ